MGFEVYLNQSTGSVSMSWTGASIVNYERDFNFYLDGTYIGGETIPAKASPGFPGAGTVLSSYGTYTCSCEVIRTTDGMLVASGSDKVTWNAPIEYVNVYGYLYYDGRVRGDGMTGGWEEGSTKTVSELLSLTGLSYDIPSGYHFDRAVTGYSTYRSLSSQVPIRKDPSKTIMEITFYYEEDIIYRSLTVRTYLNDSTTAYSTATGSYEYGTSKTIGDWITEYVNRHGLLVPEGKYLYSEVDAGGIPWPLAHVVSLVDEPGIATNHWIHAYYTNITTHYIVYNGLTNAWIPAKPIMFFNGEWHDVKDDIANGGWLL